MKKVKVFSNTYGTHTAIIDKDFHDEFKKYSWFVQPMVKQNNKKFYVRTNNKEFRSGYIFLHRLVIGAKSGEEVDHINGDTLDNRRENLRICTRKENARNREIPSNNSSGLKGVSYCKRTRRFRAYIRHNRIQRHLGYFSTAREAGAAYDRAALKLFKNFAKVNSAPPVKDWK